MAPHSFWGHMLSFLCQREQFCSSIPRKPPIITVWSAQFTHQPLLQSLQLRGWDGMTGFVHSTPDWEVVYQFPQNHMSPKKKLGTTGEGKMDVSKASNTFWLYKVSVSFGLWSLPIQDRTVHSYQKEKKGKAWTSLSPENGIIFLRVGRWEWTLLLYWLCSWTVWYCLILSPLLNKIISILNFKNHDHVSPVVKNLKNTNTVY